MVLLYVDSRVVLIGFVPGKAFFYSSTTTRRGISTSVLTESVSGGVSGTQVYPNHQWS